MGVLDQIKAKKAAALASVNGAANGAVVGLAESVSTPSTNASTANSQNSSPTAPRGILSRGLLAAATQGASKGGLAGAIAAAREQKPAVTVPSREAVPAQPISTVQMTPVTADKQAAFRAETERLRANIAYLKEHMQDVALIKDVVVAIFKQVKAAPDLHIVMQDTDYEVTMEAFKRSYQLAARTKTEKREKKATKQRDVDDFARALKDGGFMVD